MNTVRKQMSETIRIGFFLTLSGGFQDAYSYLCRGKVFANAQTGNIVLLGQNIAEGNFPTAIRYLLPLLSFVGGAYIAQKIKLLHKTNKKLHWRQMVLLSEIVLMILVGFIPHNMDTLANMTLSFVCAMQVVAFNKFHGNAYATTMCIGNLRAATTLLCQYHITKDKRIQKKEFRLLLYYRCLFDWCIARCHTWKTIRPAFHLVRNFVFIRRIHDDVLRNC